MLSTMLCLIKNSGVFSLIRFLQDPYLTNSVAHLTQKLIDRPLNQLVDKQYQPSKALINLCCTLGVTLTPNPSLDEVVKKTQQLWLRPKDVERHQLKTNHYDLRKKSALLSFVELNLIDDVYAKFTQVPYDVVLIHGSVATEVKKRIQFFEREYQRGVRCQQVILLSSDRPLDIKAEKEYLRRGLKTEAEMFYDLWKNTTSLPMSFQQSARLIKAKGLTVNRKYTRPTTCNTIYEWMKEVSLPSGSRCLAVSSQPFVAFQDFVLYNALSRKINLSFIETIGPSAHEKEPLTLYLDSLARALYEIRFSR